MTKQDVTIKTDPVAFLSAINEQRQKIVNEMGGERDLSRLGFKSLLDALTIIGFDNICVGTLRSFHLHGRDSRHQELWDDVVAQISRITPLPDDDTLDAINFAQWRGADLAHGKLPLDQAWATGA